MTWDKDETGDYVPRPLPRWIGAATTLIVLGLIGLAIAYRTGQFAGPSPEHAAAPVSEPIYVTSWDDGDSGDFSDGTEFRLSSVDAPEVGGIGAAIGAAECEAERSAGLEAKAFMEALTSDQAVRFEPLPGVQDRYGRYIGSLFVGDVDVIAEGLAKGHLRAWPHDGTTELAPPPDWCAG